jgi:hypothetical protein
LFLKTDGAGNLSFDSLSFSTPLAVIGNATAGSEIRLPEDTDNGSNYVAIKAPDTIASNLTLTLPSADGTSGQVLQTNGSGVLSFATASSGKVLQVITATDTTTRNTTSSSYVTASNTLSVSITPSSASNKIFIITNFVAYIDNPTEAHFTIFRDATNIGGSFGIATIYTEPASAQLTSPISMSILDSPNTTSATTYQVYVKAAGGGTANFSAYPSGTATITAFEIKG